MLETLLQLKDVHVHYGGVKALAGASVRLDEGEIVALMGPNGAGKSTILKAIFGLAPIESGQVLWHEQKVNPIPHEMVRRGISFVPQGRRVFRTLLVRENLEIGSLGLRGREIDERVAEMMDLFPDLKSKLKHKSGTLSGGQQQMLAIARGLMTDPKVLLLDEPSLGLSPKFVKEVFTKIKEINERRKTAIMIVEHNLQSALTVASRAYVLDKGQIVTEASPHQIIDGKILERVFLGQAGKLAGNQA